MPAILEGVQELEGIAQVFGGGLAQIPAVGQTASFRQAAAIFGAAFTPETAIADRAAVRPSLRMIRNGSHEDPIWGPGQDSARAHASHPWPPLLLSRVPILYKTWSIRRRLVVAPAAAGAPARTEPTADVVVTLSDHAFAFSTPLTAGTHTIRVDNQGPQLHEISMIQLAPGKTFADMATWEQGGMKGEPPARPVGGFIGPNVGSHGYFTVTLTPGNYALVCFVPDAKDGKPHLMHGMMQEITVS